MRKLLVFALCAIIAPLALIANDAINPRSAARFIAKGGIIVDIRTPIEWAATGVIEDSVLISFYDQNGTKLLWKFIKSLSNHSIHKSTPIVLVCNSGYRSKRAIGDLRAQGYDNLAYINGGILSWKCDNLQLVKYYE